MNRRSFLARCFQAAAVAAAAHFAPGTLRKVEAVRAQPPLWIMRGNEPPRPMTPSECVAHEVAVQQARNDEDWNAVRSLYQNTPTIVIGGDDPGAYDWPQALVPYYVPACAPPRGMVGPTDRRVYIAAS